MMHGFDGRRGGGGAMERDRAIVDIDVGWTTLGILGEEPIPP